MAIKLEKKDEINYFCLAGAYKRLKNYTLAMEAFNEAIKINPNHFGYLERARFFLTWEIRKIQKKIVLKP